jgi:hypothetical protein
MTVVPFQQRDLFTKRWRKVVFAQKEATSLHIPLVSMLRAARCIRPNVLWRHVPNGEHRDPRTAAKLKAMGVMPGCADLEFHWIEKDPDYPDRMRRRVLHLELKLPGRSSSEAQLVYALAVRLLGDDYEVARSVDEAIAILGEHGLISRGVEVGGKKW